MGRLAVPILALLVALGACRSPEPVSDAVRDASRPTSFPPTALQVAPSQLTRIELLKPREAPRQRRIALEKQNDQWRIVAPIDYRANQPAVDSIIAMLAEITVVSSHPEDERMARKYGLDETTRIEVKAWRTTEGRLESHFWVGRSRGEHTYVQSVGDSRLLTVMGRCRPLLDRTLDQLRHPVITDVAVPSIEAVDYENECGRLQLVAEPAKRGRFVPKGTSIVNFDADRAAKNVAVLAGLQAKGFVDAPARPQDAARADRAAARATLRWREPGGTQSLDVWVGSATPDGRLHLWTSAEPQVFLVAGYLRSSLVPCRDHFERSDETMRQLQTHRERLHRHAEHADAAVHSHSHREPPPSQVPPELLATLRDLAREQRAHAITPEAQADSSRPRPRE